MAQRHSTSGQRRFGARDVHRLFESRLCYMKLSPEELAGVLETKQRDMGCRVDADEIIDAVQSGQGLLTATRSAIAFTVDHGRDLGVELRCLYVAAGRRRRGAARAMVARLRAAHADRHMFFWCRNRRLAKAARLAGFVVQSRGADWWQMTTHPLPIAPVPLEGAARPLQPCPPPREPYLRKDNSRIGQLVKMLCATTLVAAASLSCIDY